MKLCKWKQKINLYGTYKKRFDKESLCWTVFLLYRIRGSKACIFFSTCQIAQFKATICRRCPCQPSTTDTTISPILLRRLLANVSANSLRSNSAPTFALTHKIGQKSPIVCLCLSGTDTICKLLSYCCAI